MVVEVERKSVAGPVELSGLGLHSGQPVGVRIEPSSNGIWFVFGPYRVQAIVAEVTDTSRCTKLGEISTVEHCMSALAGLGVTDAEVVLTANELPALGGSSEAYFEAIQATGLVTIGRLEVSLFERVFFQESEIRVGVSQGSGHWRYDFECESRWPHSQAFEAVLCPETYATEIAAARTFAFEEEVEPLLASGLAKGLDIESALILGQAGYVNPAKWPDEPARHKMLDLIGDLALSGVPPNALNVVAVRSGHRTNVAVAAKIAAHAKVVWI